MLITKQSFTNLAELKDAIDAAMEAAEVFRVNPFAVLISGEIEIRERVLTDGSGVYDMEIRSQQ